MARWSRCAEILMAEGDPEPVYPLPNTTPRFATWSLCGGRPSACSPKDCKRWHCGIDLIKAADDALVVAPEDAEVVGIDKGWSGSARAVYLRTYTGLFLVLGGTKRGSGQEWDVVRGSQVKKGDPIGRVLGSYGMIHFETYVDDGRTANSRWYVGDEPPEGLRNPLNYIQRAAGRIESLETFAQRQQVLVDLGYDPDPVGEPWGERSKAALKEAQKDLGIESDGLWGENTEAAIQAEIEKRFPECDAPDGEPCPGQTPTNTKQTATTGTARPSPASSPSLVDALRAWAPTIALSIAGAGVVAGGVALIRRSSEERP